MKLSILTLLLLFTFAQIMPVYSEEKLNERQKFHAKQREDEVARVEKVLKLTESDLRRHYKFSWKKIENGIQSIVFGQPQFLQTITYENLLLFIRGLMIKANGGSPLNVISSKTLEQVLVQGFIGGLQNKDPRVRLFTIATLKSLNLSDKTLRKIILIAKQETDNLVSYHYVDIDLNSHFGNLRIEMYVMKKVLKRKVLGKKLLIEKKIHPSLFISIRRKDFVILADRIANEPESDIPLNNLGENDINYFIAGLLNRNAYIKQRCAEFIYDIYSRKGTSAKTKKRVDNLLSNPFSFEKEMKKYGFRMAYIHNKVKYSALLVEGSKMLREVFVKKDAEKAE